MKRLTISFLSIIALVLLGKSAISQKLVTSTVTPLVKTSLKAKQWTFGYNDDGSAYQAQFITPKGKGKTIVDTYIFDSNLNLATQKSEEFTEEESIAIAIKTIASTNSKTKYDPNRKTREVKSSSYKVIAGGGLLNTKIEQGTLTAKEKWSDVVGDYLWELSYSTGSEVKVKSDDRRITTQFAIADEPNDFKKVGFWSWEQGTFKTLAPQNYLTIMGSIQPKVQKTKGTKVVDDQEYTIKTYSVKNGLNLVGEHSFSFRGPKGIVQKLQYPDGSMGVLFAPKNRVSQLGFDQSILYKANEYSYMRFGVDGKTIDSIDFVCPVIAWTPTFFEFKDESLYLAGSGSNENLQKYYFDLKDKKDQMVIMKITNGKMDFITATPAADYMAKMVKPTSQKNGFEGEVFDVHNTQLRIRDNGDIIFVGQYQYRGKNLDYMFLHFDSQGNLITHYTVKNETPQAGEVKLYDNPDGKTITWLIIEPKKVDKESGRKYNYVRLATIDPTTRTLSEFSTYGLKTSKEQKDDYFLHPVVPIIVHDKDLVFVGSDEDNNNVWLAKVALGK